MCVQKNISWMKTIHYPNKIRSHLVTIIPMAPFTPKSTSMLRSAQMTKNRVKKNTTNITYGIGEKIYMNTAQNSETA